MSKRHKKRKPAADKTAKPEADDALFNYSSLTEAVSDPQLKSIVIGALIGLAVPFLGFFVYSGDITGQYVTVMFAVSMIAIVWSLPNYKLGLTGVFLFTQPLLIYLANTNYNYTKIIYSIVFIAILGILWAIDWMRKREIEIDVSKLIWPGLVVMGVMLLSLVNSRAFLANFQYIFYVLYFIFFYLFLVNILKTEDNVRYTLRVIVLAGLGASIYALLQYFGLVLGTPGAENGTSAVISSFGNKNYMAGFLSYIFVPGMILLYRSNLVWDRIYAIVALSIIALAMLTATSESAWLALLVSLGFFGVGLWLSGEIERFRENLGWGILFSSVLIFFVFVFIVASALTIWKSPVFLSSLASAYGKFSIPAWLVITTLIVFPVLGWMGWLFKSEHRTKALISTGVAVVILVGALVSPLGGGVVGNLLKFLERNTFSTRAQDWLIGFEMFEANPIIGTGLGDYKREFLEYKAEFLATPLGANYDNYIRRAEQAHNEYVQIIAELGILGILATLFLIISLFWVFWQRIAAASSGQRWLILGLIAGVVAFIVDAFFSFPLHLPGNALALVFLLGAAHSLALGSPGVLLKLKSTGAIAAIALFIILNITVVTFAYRDWQGDIHLDRGIQLYELERNFEEGEEYLEKSLRLSFAPQSVLYRLGVVNYERFQATQNLQSLARSIDYFERSRGPFLNQNTYFYLAVLEQFRGVVAAQQLEQASSNVTQEDVDNYYQQSLSYIDELLALDPSPTLLPDILQLQAINVYNLGDTDAGIEQIEAVVAEYPLKTGIALALSRMYIEQWGETFDVEYCHSAVATLERADDHAQERIAKLNRFLNPDETTLISLNRAVSWQNELRALQDNRSQIANLLRQLLC